jgi:hypothetical protein
MSWNYGEESVSMALLEVAQHHWAAKVYKPDINGQPGNLYKKPGYTM